MDDAAIEALIEQRVQQALAEREKEQRAAALPAKQEELRARMNAELARTVQSARMEPAAGYGSGREFRRGTELSRLPGAQSAASVLVDELRQTNPEAFDD